jgi:hypothetical protein
MLYQLKKSAGAPTRTLPRGSCAPSVNSRADCARDSNRVTRNPMYLGLITVLAGWALLLGSLCPWLPVMAFGQIIATSQIRAEEAALTHVLAMTMCNTHGRSIGGSVG